MASWQGSKPRAGSRGDSRFKSADRSTARIRLAALLLLSVCCSSSGQVFAIARRHYIFAALGSSLSVAPALAYDPPAAALSKKERKERGKQFDIEGKKRIQKLLTQYTGKDQKFSVSPPKDSTLAEVTSDSRMWRKFSQLVSWSDGDGDWTIEVGIEPLDKDIKSLGQVGSPTELALQYATKNSGGDTAPSLNLCSEVTECPSLSAVTVFDLGPSSDRATWRLSPKKGPKEIFEQRIGVGSDSAGQNYFYSITARASGAMYNSNSKLLSAVVDSFSLGASK